MKVNEFVKKYNEVKLNDKLVENLVSDITKDDFYIPYLNKVALATTIAQKTMVNSESNMIALNTPMKFAISLMTIIYEATSLETSDSENNLGLYEDYDLLNKNHLVEFIIENTGIKSEYEEFNTILAMVCDDLMQNKFESHVFAVETVSMITNALAKILEPIAPALDKLTNLSDEDSEKVINKINKAVDKIIK